MSGGDNRISMLDILMEGGNIEEKEIVKAFNISLMG